MEMLQRQVLLMEPQGKSVGPEGDRVPSRLRGLGESLAQNLEETGGTLLDAFRSGALAGLRAAYIDGERHDLWWEFRLIRSLEACAQDWDLSPDLFRWRLRQTARALQLTGLLERRVLELSPAERARADLAAALLRRPEVLLWEEPFALLPPQDRTLAVRFVRSLVRSEGLTVIAAAAEAPGLDGLPAVPHLGRTRRAI